MAVAVGDWVVAMGQRNNVQNGVKLAKESVSLWEIWLAKVSRIFKEADGTEVADLAWFGAQEPWEFRRKSDKWIEPLNVLSPIPREYVDEKSTMQVTLLKDVSNLLRVVIAEFGGPDRVKYEWQWAERAAQLQDKELARKQTSHRQASQAAAAAAALQVEGPTDSVTWLTRQLAAQPAVEFAATPTTPLHDAIAAALAGSPQSVWSMGAQAPEQVHHGMASMPPRQPAGQLLQHATRALRCIAADPLAHLEPHAAAHQEEPLDMIAEVAPGEGVTGKSDERMSSTWEVAAAASFTSDWLASALNPAASEEAGPHVSHSLTPSPDSQQQQQQQQQLSHTAVWNDAASTWLKRAVTDGLCCLMWEPSKQRSQSFCTWVMELVWAMPAMLAGPATIQHNAPSVWAPAVDASADAAPKCYFSVPAFPFTAAASDGGRSHHREHAPAEFRCLAAIAQNTGTSGSSARPSRAACIAAHSLHLLNEHEQAAMACALALLMQRGQAAGGLEPSPLPTLVAATCSALAGIPPACHARIVSQYFPDTSLPAGQDLPVSHLYSAANMPMPAPEDSILGCVMLSAYKWWQQARYQVLLDSSPTWCASRLFPAASRRRTPSGRALLQPAGAIPQVPDLPCFRSSMHPMRLPLPVLGTHRIDLPESVHLAREFARHKLSNWLPKHEQEAWEERHGQVHRAMLARMRRDKSELQEAAHGSPWRTRVAVHGGASSSVYPHSRCVPRKQRVAELLKLVDVRLEPAMSQRPGRSTAHLQGIVPRQIKEHWRFASMLRVNKTVYTAGLRNSGSEMAVSVDQALRAAFGSTARTNTSATAELGDMPWGTSAGFDLLELV